MSQSPFVKPCKTCNGSGTTSSFPQKIEVCSACNGAKQEIDYDYLELFRHKIWEVSSNEKTPYVALVRDVDEGIKAVQSLPDQPKVFLSQLYSIRALLFEFLTALSNEPAYFREAVMSSKISNELKDSDDSIKGEP